MTDIPLINQLIITYPNILTVNIIGSHVFGYDDNQSDLDVMIVFDDTNKNREITARTKHNDIPLCVSSISVSSIMSLAGQNIIPQIPFRSSYAPCICLALLFCHQKYTLHASQSWNDIKNVAEKYVKRLMDIMELTCSTFAYKGFCPSSKKEIYHHAIMLNILKSYKTTGTVIIERPAKEIKYMQDIKRGHVSRHEAFTWYQNQWKQLS